MMRSLCSINPAASTHSTRPAGGMLSASRRRLVACSRRMPSVAHGRRCGPAAAVGRELADGACTTSGSQGSQGGTSRRGVLGGAAAAAAVASWTGLAGGAAHAQAVLDVVTRTSLVPYTTKAGYSLTIPDSWTTAYDRANEPGTQVLFANFRTLETLSVARDTLEGAGLAGVPTDGEGRLDVQAAAKVVLQDITSNGSTFAFELYGAARRAADPDWIELEYLQQICRGEIEEGAGGKRRCVGPRDIDLQVVSRRYVTAFTVRGGDVYVVKGSATEEAWPVVGENLQTAVRSFRLPPA